jgi:hypothetical protein
MIFSVQFLNRKDHRNPFLYTIIRYILQPDPAPQYEIENGSSDERIGLGLKYLYWQTRGGMH